MTSLQQSPTVAGILGSLFFTWSCVGCTGNQDTNARTQSDNWTECPEGYLDECTTLELPLGDNSKQGTINILVTRQLSGKRSAPQLWILTGGPGLSISDYRSWALAFSENLDVDVYGLDHRGVGGSERLGCAKAEAADSEGGPTITSSEWSECIAELKSSIGSDRLEHFTTTDAARDAGLAIAQLGGAAPVFVYGQSYGAYWALRYLQLFPNQPAGVILDSIQTPGQHLSDFDKQFDPILVALLDYCKDDALCGPKLGAQPLQFLKQVYADLKQQHCSETGITPSVLRNMLARLLVDARYRELIPALLYRLQRCDAADQAALSELVKHVFEQRELNSKPAASALLQLHIALSELWQEPPPSLKELEAVEQTALVSPGLSFAIAALHESWPRYPRDRFVNAWPETSVPILMLNGTWDAQTPIGLAGEAGRKLQAPNQHFLALPWASHGVAFHSAVTTPFAPACGTQLIRHFIAEPATEPNDGCIADLAPPSFVWDPAMAEFALGQNDLWENDDAKP